MKTVAIWHKDLEDVVRSKLVWAALGLFLLLIGIIGLGIANAVEEEVGTETFANLFAQLGAWLMLPLIAIMLGYMAIVGERQSGSLRILFGLGFNRKTVLAGKVASRTTAMAVVTTIALGFGLGITLIVGDTFDLGLFLRFAGLTLLFAVMFTAVAIAASAAASTRYRAMGGAVGIYILFALLWHPIAAGIHYLVEGSLPAYEAPTWYFLLTRLNPLEAYNQVVSIWIDEYVWGLIGWVTIVEDIDVDVENQALLLTDRVGEDLPFYLTDWFALVIIATWIVVPLAIGYWWFSRADLN